MPNQLLIDDNPRRGHWARVFNKKLKVFMDESNSMSRDFFEFIRNTRTKCDFETGVIQLVVRDLQSIRHELAEQDKLIDTIFQRLENIVELIDAQTPKKEDD